MASRPLTFGVRFREKGRTVQVRAHERDTKRYVLEVRRPGEKIRRHEHASLSGALRGFAVAWRSRLH
jgi:anti-sigma factor ChrR (cupin superfamily)